MKPLCTLHCTALLAICILTSCNSEKMAVKKFAKYKEKYPKLFVTDTVKIDTTITITIRDTFYIPGDSIEGLVPTTDTTITSDKLSIQFWKDKYNGLMRYKTTLKPAPIYRDTTIKVPVYIEKPCPVRLSDEAIAKNYVKNKTKSFFKWLGNLLPLYIWLILALLVSFFLYRRISK